MSSRAEALGRYVACGLAFPLAALAVDPVGQFQPTHVSVSPDRGAGLQAFAQIERVLLNPRCVNCHVPDGPLQGDAKRVHYPAVQRGVDGKGIAPLNCATCHSTQNSLLAHAPPGLDTGGQPGWRMPPAKMKMSWLGLSGSALCKVFRDPKTNGGRTLAAIEQHLVTDHLVAWGWNPGPGRQLPPLDKVAFDEQVGTWIRNGAPCDSNEPLRKSVGRSQP
jgi:mono/diheme cytochrome c family protein